MRLLFLVPLVVVAVQAQTAEAPLLLPVPPAPEQPLPFSHKTHAAQGLDCKTCHEMPDPGYFAEIAPTAVCMDCHKEVKSDSPAIQTLAKAHAAGEEIEWEPVYMVPDFVYFSHRKHVDAGAACSACHGDVAAKDALAKERNISMPGCIACHKAAQASVECDFCHATRGADLFEDF